MLLLDGQYIRVTALNGTTTVNSAIIDGNTVNETSANIKLVQDASGSYFIKFIPTNSFTSIKVENFRSGATGIVGSRWIDVYGAYYVSGTASCTMASYTGYTGGGLVSADLTAGAGNTDGYKAIDASASTYSKLSIGTLGVAAFVEQNFYFEGTSATTDKYNVKFKVAPSLVQVGLLDRISIRGYVGTSTTPVYSASATSLLSVDLLGLLQNDQTTSFTVTPGVVIDRLAIRITGVANASLSQELNIYSVTRGNFGVTVSGGATVQVGAVVTLTANVTGCSTYTYAWSNGLTSTTNTTTVPTTTPGTTTYTVTVTDAYGIQKTGTATVTVSQPPVAGTLSGGGTICYGDAPGNLTLSGYTGSVLYWEKATNPAFTGAVTIVNSTNTLPGSALGTITQTTYVRAVIGLNAYPNVYASTSFVINTTTWNGTAWSNGTPDLSTMVYITGNYSTAANLNACALEISNGAVVNIPSEYTVTVKGFVKVLDTSTFTLQHNAHLVQITDAINQGKITQIRNSQSLFRLDYTLWSSPVDNQLLQTFSPATSTTRFYDYYYGQNTAGQWLEAYWPVNPATTYFETGTGYLIRMPNSNSAAGYSAGTTQITFTGIFTGEPHNGTLNKAMSTLNNRWTATGNPYPSPINVQAFFDANESKLQAGATLYFWRKKNDQNASSYATLTREAYVSNQAIGGAPGEDQYGGIQWDAYFNENTLPADWIINPGQGFFVQTATGLSSPQLTFTNSMRRAIHNQQFFKSAAPQAQAAVTMSRYWLEMKNTTEYSQMAVVYTPNATLGLDSGHDAKRFEESTLALYSIAEETNLAIQARPEFAAGDIVPLGYNAITAGQYTIDIRRKDGVFGDGQKIYLRDKAEGLTRDLTQSSYTFTTEAGSFNNRFEVIYTTTALNVDTAAATPNSVMVYKAENIINVSAGTSLINSVKVYDMRGRTLYSADAINNTTAQVSNLTAQTQILLVEVNTVNGTVTKKIAY